MGQLRFTQFLFSKANIHLLHKDLMIEVLLRLPAESLSRCKFVCKDWQAMINDPDFMHQYLLFKYYNNSTIHHGRRLQQLICRTYQHGPEADNMMYAATNDDLLTELKGAPCISNVYHDIICRGVYVSGPINGMYCIFESTRPYRITFWNPAYEQFHVLPPIPCFMNRLKGSDDQSWSIFVGFDFDPLSNDYKVFCVSEYRFSFVSFYKYSLASNSWQELHHSQIAYARDIFTSFEDGRSDSDDDNKVGRCMVRLAFTFNGWCRWICWGDPLQMLCFEMARDVFRLITIPRAVISAVESVVFEMFGGQLMTVDGCIAVAFLRRKTRDVWAIGIGVMKEYGVEESWVLA